MSYADLLIFAKRIIDELQGDSHEAYIVGGYVRDGLLKRPSKDIDIATSCPIAIAEKLLTQAGIVNYLVNAAQAYPVLVAEQDAMKIEIAQFRQDNYGEVIEERGRRPQKMSLGTLSQDAKRRDFTINALYLNPLTNIILDPTGLGKNDLVNQVLRFVGEAEQRIEEDPLRILRAVRFKNGLGFKYTAETVFAVMTQAKQISRLSPERLGQEFTGLILMPERVAVLNDLVELGIAELILPEWVAGKGVAQSKVYHSEGDVFTHQLLVMAHLPENASAALVWSALLHDIGKPISAGVNSRGDISFYEHDIRGADLAAKIMHNFRFSEANIQAVVWLIKQHMRVWQLPHMSRSKQLGLICHPLFSDLLLLMKADTAASLRSNGQPNWQLLEEIERLAMELQEEVGLELPTAKTVFGVDGRMLIEYLSIQTSQQRKLGDLIKYLDVQVQEKSASTREEMLVLAKAWWEKN